MDLTIHDININGITSLSSAELNVLVVVKSIYKRVDEDVVKNLAKAAASQSMRLGYDTSNPCARGRRRNRNCLKPEYSACLHYCLVQILFYNHHST